MPETMIVGKLDAARRQLQTAITLWFNGGDQVAIHALAYAAYEIIHAISKKRNPQRDELLFDMKNVRPEKRVEFANAFKRHGNFFKHADRDGDAVIEFNPELSQWFMYYSTLGLHYCGERYNKEEAALLTWLRINCPHILTDEGRDMISKAVSVDDLEDLRRLPKHQLFQICLQAAQIQGMI